MLGYEDSFFSLLHLNEATKMIMYERTQANVIMLPIYKQVNNTYDTSVLSYVK